MWQQPLSAKVPSCRSLSRSKNRGKGKRDRSVLKGIHVKMIDHPRQPLRVNTGGSRSHTELGSLDLQLTRSQSFPTRTLPKLWFSRAGNQEKISKSHSPALAALLLPF